MANLTVTNNDVGSVVLMAGDYKDELLVFAAEDTFAEGMILARQAVNLTVVATADGSNTGNGTVTLMAVTPGVEVPIVGSWILTCTALITNGGTFSLVDPNGAQAAVHDFITTPQTVELAGFTITFTDGSTDWAVGDFFTCVVVANGKMVPYAIAGAGGAQYPKAVLTYEAYKAAAGNLPIRMMISGSVIKERLVLDADGDASNITDAILDQLRSYTIVSQDTLELGDLDNQT